MIDDISIIIYNNNNAKNVNNIKQRKQIIIVIIRSQINEPKIRKEMCVIDVILKR